MMDELSRRAWRSEMNADEGRIITGIAVPYDNPTMIAERGRVFEERFAPGAFDDSIAKRGNRIPVLLMHDDRALPVGKPVGFRSTADGLVMDARISETADGNDALTLVRDGVLSGLSVGFSVPAGGETWSADRSVRTITSAQLHEVSIVNFPAYDDARIASVRAAQTRSDVTFDDITEAVEEALEHALGVDDVTSDLEVCDITDTWAVFTVDGALEDTYPGYWQATYTIVDGVVTVGIPTQVEKVYVPASVPPVRNSNVETLLRLWQHR